jgi:penicillin-binding protein 1A
MQLVIRLLTAAMAVAASLVLLAGAVGSAGYFYLAPALPSAETIREVRLQTPLRVYSRDRRLLAQMGEQKRTPVRFKEIPEVVIKAFLAAEDDRFFEHPGFDYQGIIRAAFNLLVTGERSQGGSTITQQLARAYFLTPERSFVRKARELILALQIEQEFSKAEILSLYLNKIFLGQRAYGIAAAAEVYFGKSLDELTLAEAATLAAIPKAPSQLNPVSGPARAAQRRIYVLDRMRELGYIDEDAYLQARDSPLESRLHGPKLELDAPYVAEMVRAELLARFGPAAYTDGYSVVTTVDSRLQRAANHALATALVEYDRRHGYRGPLARNLLTGIGAASADTAPAALQAALARYPGNEHLHPAVVLEIRGDNSVRFHVRDIGEVVVPWVALRWRRYLGDDSLGPTPQNAAELLAPGDVVHLLRTLGGWQLGQMPQVQGALVAVDPHDGATLALVGGFDFYASKFNRAVQARRQPGSSFKPFIYSAGLEHGFSVASVINDAPLVFGDSELEDVWRPENYSREFNGPTRMREALVKSLNLVSVRILMGTGIENAVRHIRAFGFDDTALPRNLSIALGSGGASPWDIAAGYAVFANGGRRVEHYVVDQIFDAEDRLVWQATPRRTCAPCSPPVMPEVDPAAAGPADTFAVDTGTLRTAQPLEAAGAASDAAGDEVPYYSGAGEMIAHAGAWQPTSAETPLLYRDVPVAPRVISEENAFLVYDMMRDVILRGTGRSARDLGRADIAGKTGTSNDRRDAWFSGLNANIVATAWIGFDQERSLGAREEGGRTALPMWKYFMAQALRGTPEAPLLPPPTLVTTRISPASGQLAAADDPGAIFEYLRATDLTALEQSTPAFGTSGGGPLPADAGADIF